MNQQQGNKPQDDQQNPAGSTPQQQGGQRPNSQQPGQQDGQRRNQQQSARSEAARGSPGQSKTSGARQGGSIVDDANNEQEVARSRGNSQASGPQASGRRLQTESDDDDDLSSGRS